MRKEGTLVLNVLDEQIANWRTPPSTTSAPPHYVHHTLTSRSPSFESNRCYYASHATRPVWPPRNVTPRSAHPTTSRILERPLRLAPPTNAATSFASPQPDVLTLPPSGRHVLRGNERVQRARPIVYRSGFRNMRNTRGDLPPTPLTLEIEDV